MALDGLVANVFAAEDSAVEIFEAEYSEPEVLAKELFAAEVFALEPLAFDTMWLARFNVNESIVLVAGDTVVSGRGVVVLTAMDSTAMEIALNVMRRNPNWFSA